ncbi:ABC transporter permease [Brevibacillus choshinensis]|uniref:ABC transporter permease n=1 Tax=Brevibacillus choshinensis TaxID=54911 RepID=A0ABX7FLS3_BRECH|nr:ABC transporter permease [Brevibacillus choshinensis]QRG66795.1 ABC transporter permease [Brevibacillus choshinensis]
MEGPAVGKSIAAIQNPAKTSKAAAELSTWAAFAKNKMGLVAFIVLLLFIVIALAAPLIVPYDPLEQNTAQRLQGPSADHFLGTDSYGRDVFSRILIGSQTSLIVGFIGVAISGIIGFSIGMIAGYKGGWIDDILMRILESIMTIPLILLGMMVLVALSSNLSTMILVISIGLIPGCARIARGSTLEIKEKEFIKATISMGGSSFRIIFMHILPNILGPLLVVSTLNMASVIRIEASLSFLGMGVKPPTPTWGNMIQEGFQFITLSPGLSLYPGIALMILSIAFNLIGDAMRDAIDPHLKHQRK